MVRGLSCGSGCRLSASEYVRCHPRCYASVMQNQQGIEPCRWECGTQGRIEEWKGAKHFPWGPCNTRATMRATFDERRMQALATCLEADDQVLALGRAFESADEGIQDLGAVVSGPGSAVIVTSRRLLWTSTSDLRWMRTLPLDSVISYRELFQAHRYALVIDHGAIAVLQRVPKHRVLWWRWGSAVDAIDSQTTTILAFSRQTTEVAEAIKTRLKSLGSVAYASRTMPHSRDDGAAGTYLTLSPRPPRHSRRKRSHAANAPENPGV